MNYSFKLKCHPHPSAPKQQSSVRRIRTDHLDTLKKHSKQPLVDNKKIINSNNLNIQPNKSAKKITYIKSNLNKHLPSQSRLITQPLDKVNNGNHQRTATTYDRLSLYRDNLNPKSININLNNTNVCKSKKHPTKIRQNSNKLPLQSAKNIQNNPIDSNSNLLKKQKQSRYQIDKKIGFGTFGTVHKARDKKTLQTVAIKKVFQDKNYKNRQLDILRIINHPNVLSMKDSFFTYQNDKEYLNVVMDYYQCNLYQAIHKYSHKKNLMPKLKLKVYAYQLFRSLLYLREIGIAHRDIKPHNILVNENKLKLVLCDFGSAKQLKPNQPNIAYICSRCYRAPQLIFGNTQYTTQIDIWSIGCVLAQMVILQPLFQGDSNIDQLVEIIKVLGCPSNKQILQMNPDYDINKFQLPKIKSKSWNKIFPSAEYLGEDFIDLMKHVLCYSPHLRYSPFQALTHSFFNQLKDEVVYRQLQKQYGIQSLFNFTQIKKNSNIEVVKLVPNWYQAPKSQ